MRHSFLASVSSGAFVAIAGMLTIGSPLPEATAQPRSTGVTGPTMSPQEVEELRKAANDTFKPIPSMIPARLKAAPYRCDG